MTPAYVILLLAVALWAPAVLIFGAGRRPPEPALAVSERMVLAAALALVLVGWTSLVLATLGVFSGPALLGGLSALGVVATILCLRKPDLSPHPRVSASPRRGRGDAGTGGRREGEGERGGEVGPEPSSFRSSAAPCRDDWRSAALLLTLLAGAVALYQPPFTYVVGGLDPGVYVNTAAHVVRTGSLVWRDADLAALPADLRDVLFQEPPQPFSFGSRQIGLYITDIDAGLVVPHGLHLYPVLMAALWWAGGPDLALRTGMLAALVALAAVFCCARRVGGLAAGGLAAGALAGAIGQSWFARYPAAEPVAQMQVWAGLLALLVVLRGPSWEGPGGGRMVPLLGGMLLGSAHLTKIEIVAVPAGLIGLAVWAWLAGRWTKSLGWYLVGYGALAGHAALHAAIVAPWYTTTALGLARYPSWVWLAASAAMLAAAIGLWIGRAEARRLVAWGTSRRRGLATVLSALLVAVALWAYLIRPLGSETSPPYEANNLQSLVRLGWYTAPPLVPLAVAGLAVTLAQGGAGALVLAAVGLAEAALQLSDARITPLHFWAGRRLVTLLTPAVAIFAALALVRLWTLRGRAWPRSALVLGAVAWIAWYDVTINAPFLGHVEYAGARENVAALAALVPLDGIVLYEWADEAWRVALPLDAQFGVRGFLVPPSALADARLPALLRWLRDRNSAVYWLSAGGNLDWLPPGLTAAHIATRVLAWPEAERTYDSLPGRVGRYLAVVDLYRLAARAGAERVVGPVLDVGGDDRCCLGGGFGPPTQVAGCAACRWAGPVAGLDVPAPAGEGTRELVLALSGGPAMDGPRRAEVWADGTLLGAVPLARGFRTYYLALRESQGPSVRVELRGPDTSGGPPMAVDWARIDLVR